LKAQRDLLKAQKAEKREKELEEFNKKTTNQADLHKELLEMDKKIKPKRISPSKTGDFDEESLNLSDHKEVDKRL
jgi:hypothetical protein